MKSEGKCRVLYAVSSEMFSSLFSEEDQDRIGSCCEVVDAPRVEEPGKEFLLKYAPNADIVITSWGTAPIDADVCREATDLKMLAHAGGSVKPVVTDASWENNIRVVSGAAAIAHGVAEFCLGLILTATKRSFWAGVHVQSGMWDQGMKVFNGPQEIYGQKIGVIGAGHVGRQLIRLLQNFSCEVVIFDPYVSEEEAQEMGAEKIESLDELFSECMVVSLNAPSTEETKNMIRGEHFRCLQKGALFINTARGKVVQTEEMVEELRKGEFVACIDVTDPEPPPLDSPLRHLPNVWLTPHQAGTVAQNLMRIGKLVADGVEAFCGQKALTHEVTREQLKHIG